MNVDNSYKINFFKSSESFEKLDKLSKKKRSKSLLNFIKNKFNILKKFTFKIKRSQDALRTQEHLLKEGSLINFHLKAFTKRLDMLGTREARSFGKALNNMDSAAKGFTLRKLAKNRWIEKQVTSIMNLKSGESHMIDASSAAAGHGMILRFEKKDGKTNLYFSNTGLGAYEHPDFHPITKTKEGKALLQTTAIIEDILRGDYDLKTFLNDFTAAQDQGRYTPSMRSRLEEKPKEKSEVSLKEGKLDPIKKMYVILRQLGIPKQTNFEHEGEKRCWGRAQMGSSCVPSSLWAMGKTMLPKDQIRELKTDMRIKSLLRNYQHYKNGYDRSSTNIVLMLDQVQKLKRISDKYYADSQLSEILSNVQKEITTKANAKQDIEAPIRGVRIPDKIPFLEAHFNSKSPSQIGAKVRFEPIALEGELKNVSFQKGDTGRFEPKSIDDAGYLLYVHVASGDEKNTVYYLNCLLEKIKENKEEMKNRKENLAFPAGIDPEINDHLARLFLKLSTDLGKFDRTRSGLAKQYFMILLVDALAIKTTRNVYNDLIDKKLKSAKENYDTLHVRAYLSQDNIWVHACDELEKQRDET